MNARAHHGKTRCVFLSNSGGVACILKLARTIADLAGSDAIETPHLAEAIQYRPRMGHRWLDTSGDVIAPTVSHGADWITRSGGT